MRPTSASPATISAQVSGLGTGAAMMATTLLRPSWAGPLLVLFCARQAHPEAPFDGGRAGQNLALAA